MGQDYRNYIRIKVYFVHSYMEVHLGNMVCIRKWGE